jgi:flagellar hook assembly protein FlgD
VGGDVPQPGHPGPRPAPNPFNPRTTVRFTLPQAARATLSLYDQRGCLVRTLVAAALPAGEQAVTWDGRDDGGRSVASGVYVVRLSTSQGVLTGKVTLAR